MKTRVRAPTHVCPACGEWWMVEPLAQDKWTVFRYGDHTRCWKESAILPVCPDCQCAVLDFWSIDDGEESI